MSSGVGFQSIFSVLWFTMVICTELQMLCHGARAAAVLVLGLISLASAGPILATGQSLLAATLPQSTSSVRAHPLLDVSGWCFDSAAACLCFLRCCPTQPTIFSASLPLRAGSVSTSAILFRTLTLLHLSRSLMLALK